MFFIVLDILESRVLGSYRDIILVISVIILIIIRGNVIDVLGNWF